MSRKSTYFAALCQTFVQLSLQKPIYLMIRKAGINKPVEATIMKKIFLSLVFLFGVGTFVMADDTMKVKNDTVAVEDGFKNIDLKEVPQSVKDAIAKKYPESTLKSASLSLKEEGVKAYRIIYVTKEGVENSILINIKTAPAKTAPATK